MATRMYIRSVDQGSPRGIHNYQQNLEIWLRYLILRLYQEHGGQILDRKSGE